MSKDQVNGRVNQATGKMKKAVGTGQSALGDVKNDIKNGKKPSLG